MLLLEAWRDAEIAASKHAQASAAGGGQVLSRQAVAAVEARMPRKIKMRRMATAEDGSELGWEEYYDYHFPDDEKKIGQLVSQPRFCCLFVAFLLLFLLLLLLLLLLF